MPIYDYTVEAVNQIYELMHQGESENVNLQVLEIACNTFTRLEQDYELLDEIGKGLHFRLLHRRKFQDLLFNTRHFTEHFLNLERKLLIEGRIAPEVAEKLIDRITKLGSCRKHWRASFEDLIIDIQQVREEACLLEAELREYHSRRRRRKRIAQRVFLAMSGVAICAINISPVGYQNLRPEEIGVSTSSGAALIREAIPLRVDRTK